MRSANKTQTNTAALCLCLLHSPWDYLFFFTAFKLIMLSISFEKVAVKFWFRVSVQERVELGLARVVGFTAFKPFKSLVSLEKRTTCPFYCFKSFNLLVSLDRKTLNLSVSVKRNK